MTGKRVSEVVLDVRVIPRSPRTAVAGRRGNAILIRVAAPPVDGAANDALLRFLSDTIGVPRRAIRLVSGETSRDKRVGIAGVDLPAVLAALRVG
jgi:uncharacterized protein (TIGR00251 family)